MPKNASIARTTHLALFLFTLTSTTIVGAMPQERTPDGRAHNPGLPGWCETDAADRQAEAGCYTTAIADLGTLPATPIYWHLDAFPSRAEAEKSRGPRSTAVDSQHRHWLFTIAEAGWRPTGGERIAMIGPLVIDPAVPYTARYLEAVMTPGFQDGVGKGHWHPGPEAWYVLEGAQCLETPSGARTIRKGETLLAPEGEPMTIASVGGEMRRTVFMVLHRSSQPYVLRQATTSDAPHAHWESKGLCPR